MQIAQRILSKRARNKMKLQLNAKLKPKFISPRIFLTTLALFLLLQLSAANLSAETNKIAYAYGNAIYKMNPDGSNIQQLTNSGQRDYSPVWSPDGTKIAFIRWTIEYIFGDTDIPIDNSSFGIYTIDNNGGNLTQIKSGQAFVNDLTWSPDGTKLAFVQGADSTHAGYFCSSSGVRNIYVVDAVANGAARPVEAAAGGVDPSWSSDGMKIFYAVNHSIDEFGIYSIDLSDDSVTRLTYDYAPPADPEISPDGSKIVYAIDYPVQQSLFGNMSTMGPTTQPAPTDSNLILYDLAQNSLTVLADGASSPVWNANGSIILYIRRQTYPGSGWEVGGELGEPELTTIAVNGQNRTTIPNMQTGEISASWSR
jgi:Tol biopolymer transport system component